MQTAGHTTEQQADSGVDTSEPIARESVPSGGQILEQNGIQSVQQRVGHVCEGPRCPCQRYDELAVVVMNRNRNHGNQEREDCYQNVGRGQQQQRIVPSRANNGLPVNPHFLNPQYQNPVDILRNCNRNGRINEPEENIYERLDDYEDDDDQRAEGARQENFVSVEANNGDNHTYERIDNRPWYRGGLNNRPSNDQASQHLPSANFWNFFEPAPSSNHYDHPRYAYSRSRMLDHQSCLNRLGRLGRNCFSSENIASAANPRRYVYQLGHSRMCPSCARFSFAYRDARYVCQYCNNFHDRLRYYEHGNATNSLGNSRHYIYQVSRSCRCPFCRGDYQFARFPMNSSRLAESFRRECHCRNLAGCTCRGRIMSSSNSAIYIGRIDRVGLVQSVNNPMYASPTIYIGRIDRSCASGLSNVASSSGTANSSTESSAVASVSNAAIPSTSGLANVSNEPSTSTSQRAGGHTAGSTGGASSVCSIGQSIERQHVCDDSCIRSHPGNVTGVCQFLGRSERPDYHNGRLSFHWWFVNRWLPPWGSQSQSTERNQSSSAAADQPPTPRIDESRDQHESDTEESRD